MVLDEISSTGLVALGLVLLGVLFFDLLSTTIVVGRAGGVISKQLGRAIWAVGLAVHRRIGRAAVLQACSYLILTAIIAAWTALLWTAWTLIFLASPTAVVDAETLLPATLWERTYFIGFTITTLGVGDYTPGTDLWRNLTPVVALTGFLVVSLTVTYLLSVASAAVTQRRLALRIAAAGETPYALLTNRWDGSRFVGLEAFLRDLESDLARSSQQHLAYPILLWFHSAERRTALPLGLATLSEALTLLEFGVAASARPRQGRIRAVRFMVDDMLRSTESIHSQPHDEPPPPCLLDPLRAAGIDVVPEASWRDAVRSLGTMRRRLRGFVESDGWQWRDVCRPNEPREEEGGR